MEPRLIKLLDVLQKNANKVVTKEEIMETAWKDVSVNEDSISRAVHDLRKYLNERFSDPPHVETIRKVGYRLVLDHEKRTGKILKRTAKLFAYGLAGLIFLVLLIRAINY